MVEIYDIRKERQERARPLASYFVRVDLYDDGIAGAVLDMGDDLSPEQQRTVANHLATLSRWLRDQAAEIDDNDDETLVTEVRVFRSSRVWTWTDARVRSDEELEWLDRRFDDAKAAVRPTEEGD